MSVSIILISLILDCHVLFTADFTRVLRHEGVMNTVEQTKRKHLPQTDLDC